MSLKRVDLISLIILMCAVIWAALKITEMSPLFPCAVAVSVTPRLPTSTDLTSRACGSLRLLKGIQENQYKMHFIKSGSESLCCKQVETTGIIGETGVVLGSYFDLVLLL